MNIRAIMPVFHMPRWARLRRSAAAGLLATVQACAPSLPPIAQGIGDTDFKARIADRFPPGSRAALLRRELARQGFAFLEDPLARRYSAIERPDNPLCFSETRIDWTENRQGRIVLIQAARHVCS